VNKPTQPLSISINNDATPFCEMPPTPNKLRVGPPPEVYSVVVKVQSEFMEMVPVNVLLSIVPLLTLATKEPDSAPLELTVNCAV
jgi:hypothetical protein